MDNPTQGAEQNEPAVVKHRDPWAELERIAREIQPDLPADLSRYEVRIIMHRDFQAVELIALDFIDKIKGAP